MVCGARRRLRKGGAHGVELVGVVTVGVVVLRVVGAGVVVVFVESVVLHEFRLVLVELGVVGACVFVEVVIVEVDDFVVGTVGGNVVVGVGVVARVHGVERGDARSARTGLAPAGVAAPCSLGKGRAAAGGSLVGRAA